MGKASNILFLGAGVAAAYAIATRVYNIKEGITKLSVSNISLAAKPSIKALSIVVDITLDILNPSSTAIPFEYYAGTLMYEGSKVADFNFNDNGRAIMLKARGKTPLTFQIQVSNLAIGNKLYKMIIALNAGKKVNTKLDVQSIVYAAGVDVPVNFGYDLKTLSVVNS